MKREINKLLDDFLAQHWEVSQVWLDHLSGEITISYPDSDTFWTVHEFAEGTRTRKDLLKLQEDINNATS